MKKVYFEIFGKKMAVNVDDKAKSLYTKDQIEYYVRGQVEIHKIEDVPEKKDFNFPNELKEIFGGFKH